MRKLRIDSNVLYGFSTGIVPLSPLFRKSPELINSTLRNDDFRRYRFSQELNSARNFRITEKRSFSDLKKINENSLYSEMFANEENSKKRPSTFEDVQLAVSLLKEIIEYRKNNVSNWIIESKIKQLCNFYKCFLKDHKSEFIQVLAQDYGVSHKQIFQSAQTLSKYDGLSEVEAKSDARIIKKENHLRNVLTPQYSWLFLHIGKLEKGVKFLVDLRTDVLDLVAEKNAEGQSTIEMHQLNNTLRELLSLWFSIGFLHLKRVTWSSSCEMLQKISEYEAVHPVRNWRDLKRRVGPYRRCFVFLHPSMPGEPIVVLHTALCDEIASNMKGIVFPRSRISVDHTSQKELLVLPQDENPNCVKAAVFYSITSTQKGLQGIELGNYLIKSVVQELQIEFSHVCQFSSLSPIPNFKSWLLEKLKTSEKGSNETLVKEEVTSLKSHLNSSDFWRDLRKLIFSNSWAQDKELIALLEKPLMRLCARYLYLEKRRGYAFDSVANFHLKNGAVMWRLNWLGDTTPRGFGNSCSIMINYRYFLDEVESNSRTYLEKKIISASDQVLKLAKQAQQLIIVSKL